MSPDRNMSVDFIYITGGTANIEKLTNYIGL